MAAQAQGALKGNKLRDGFVSLSENLLSSIADVFPECDETRHALELYRVVVKGDPSHEDKFVRKCSELFKQNSIGLKEHDEEALFTVVGGINLLTGIDIRSKWGDPDFSAESKDNMWQYLSALETYGGLYCAVPPGVMERIEKVASTMGESMKAGTLDISTLDLSAFGEDLVAGLSSEEVKDFEGSLPDVYSCVGNVAAMLAKQSGNDSFDAEALVKRVVEMQNSATEGAVPNLSGFIQEIGGAVCPGGNDSAMASMVATMAKQMLQGGAGGKGNSGGGKGCDAQPALCEAESCGIPGKKKNRRRR
jgi:hypothetical protein